MYIPQFVCGIIATIGAELGIFIVAYIVSEVKKGKENKDHE